MNETSLTASTDPPRFVVVICTRPEQRTAALQIRMIVFVEEQQVPAELEPDEYDDDAQHLLALREDDGIPVGTARIVDKGNGVGKIGRVAVLPEFRSRGIGRSLMHTAIAEMHRKGFHSVFLDAQLQVIPFYERLGFVAEGPIFDDAGIDHRRMTRALS